MIFVEALYDLGTIFSKNDPNLNDFNELSLGPTGKLTLHFFIFLAILHLDRNCEC
jgi:hypothetical protein